MSRRATSWGYILLETVVAMGVLSIGIGAMQGAIRQAIITRGQSQDYTVARLLLQRVAAEFDMQRLLRESEGSGQFFAPDERFSYQWALTTVEIPKPEVPGNIPPDIARDLLKKLKDKMPKLTVRVMWSRAGRDFEAVGETFYSPEKLWTPPPPEVVPQ